MPTEWDPPGATGTWKEVETEPSLSAENERTAVPSKVMLTVALAPKPEPVRLMVVPGGPLVGLMESNEVTVKLFGDTPSTLTWYERAERGGTLNEVVNPPLESDAVVSTCSAPNMTAMPPRPAAKPTPVTVTRVPTAPRLGERVILDSTAKVAVAVPTLIVWEPKADGGTRKLWAHGAPLVLTDPTEVVS